MSMVYDKETRRRRIVTGVIIALLICLVIAFGYGLYRDSRIEQRFVIGIDDPDTVYMFKYKADTIEEFNRDFNEFLEYLRGEGIKITKIENTPTTELGVTIWYRLSKNKYLDGKGRVKRRR